MKYEWAVITTDSDSTNLPMPVDFAKVKEVAAGHGNFSCAQDTEIAKWMLKVNEILTLR